MPINEAKSISYECDVCHKIETQLGYATPNRWSTFAMDVKRSTGNIPIRAILCEDCTASMLNDIPTPILKRYHDTVNQHVKIERDREVFEREASQPSPNLPKPGEKEKGPTL